MADDSEHPLLDFVKSDYSAKIDYLIKQFDRLWARFNFFLSFEAALFAAFGFIMEKKLSNSFLWAIPVVGIIASLAWFVAALEDRRLVELYRQHVAEAFTAVRDAIAKGSQYTLAPDYKYVGQPDPQAWNIKRTLKIPHFSITTMPAFVALLFLLGWIGLLYLLLIPPTDIAKGDPTAATANEPAASGAAPAEGAPGQ